MTTMVDKLNVPLTYVVVAILFTISSTLTIEFRYAKAYQVQALEQTVKISSKEGQLLQLQTRLFQAQTPAEKQFIQAQIERLEREIEALYTK